MTKSSLKLEAQLARLALARLPGEKVDAERRLEWTTYRWVLLAAGIDPHSLEWDGRRYRETDVVERWVEPLSGSWEYLHAKVPGFPPRRHTEWSSIFALGCALRGMFGLRHHQVGSHKTNYYKVDTEWLERQKGLLKGEQHGK